MGVGWGETHAEAEQPEKKKLQSVRGIVAKNSPTLAQQPQNCSPI